MTDIWFVKAQDAYVDPYGHRSDPEFFGPWDNLNAAQEAMKYLSNRMIKNPYGTSDVKVKMYEWVEIEQSFVKEVFDEHNIWM